MTDEEFAAHKQKVLGELDEYFQAQGQLTMDRHAKSEKLKQRFVSRICVTPDELTHLIDKEGHDGAIATLMELHNDAEKLAALRKKLQKELKKKMGGF